ncbi:O-antigen ligase family protein [Gloeocapsopsis dulcis]|uniref:Polymerase n=1 Tax=Gloeocapsopsis dulcis AAB1 = 1H9 TaxID=1433147 RepID=A0A6N8FNZ3_9CHRO|nr:O-antigen ligase family protein [Gloeocapsopsis dulcis]MUL35033.1 polymerase [Gloeocapsopsis dulcis AAB1 = 1H9]WNN89889.1 O-antigen ligase family protein [Gloeocapsopsis dulcis]
MGKKRVLLQQHSTARLQTAWSLAQLGLLAFPLVPILGALGIFLALVDTWRHKYRNIVNSPLYWGLAILATWLVLTAIFAYDRVAATLGLFNFLPFFILFAAFSTLIQTPAQLRQLAKILVITSIPAIVLGFGQLLLNWTTPASLSGVLGWTLVAQGNPPGRMASVFMYANILAGYLVITFILALGLWLEGLTAKVKQINNNKLLLMAVVGNFAALILTNSRNAWAIACCAIFAFAVYQGWRWLVMGVSAIIGAIFLAAFAPSPLNNLLRTVVPQFFWVRLTDQLYPNRPIPFLRTTQWQFALSLTQQRPLTGWGLRNFTPLYENHMHVWLGHPHNFFLMFAAETGILGIVFLSLWVGWILFRSIQLLRNWQSINSDEIQIAQDKLIFFSYLVAFFACVVFNTVDVTIFDLRLNTLAWILLAAICGVCKHTHISKPFL